MFLHSHYKTFSGLSAFLVHLHISPRAWEMLGSCLTDFKALESQWGCLRCSGLWHTFIYILCPFHAGFRQILWHWCSGTGSFSTGQPQQTWVAQVYNSSVAVLSFSTTPPTWRFYHFPSLHSQTWSGTGHLPELFFLLTSIQRIFTSSRLEKT